MIKPLKSKSLPGGILADEMGLGKTLEILGTILMNPRQLIETERPSIQRDEKQIKKNKDVTFSCLCGNAPHSMRLNGSHAYQNSGQANKRQRMSYAPSQESLNSSIQSSQNDEEPIYQCKACNAWTHVNCVNYHGSEDDFLCLYCCTKVPPIPSR